MTIGGVSHNSIQRSLAAISLGTTQALEQRRAEDWIDAADEYDQQFRLPLRFVTRDAVVRATVEVSFDATFLIAVPGRDGSVDRPQFTYGFETTAGEVPLLSAAVKAYRDGDDGFGYSGAEIVVACWTPNPHGKRKKNEWSGFLHASFQGYAIPLHEYPDDEELAEDI